MLSKIMKELSDMKSTTNRPVASGAGGGLSGGYSYEEEDDMDEFDDDVNLPSVIVDEDEDLIEFTMTLTKQSVRDLYGFFTLTENNLDKFGAAFPTLPETIRLLKESVDNMEEI